jgi:hypothetical protein
MIFSYVMMLALIGHTCIQGSVSRYFNESSICDSDTGGDGGEEGSSISPYIGVTGCQLLRFIDNTSDMYFMIGYLVVWTSFQFLIHGYYYRTPASYM